MEDFSQDNVHITRTILCKSTASEDTSMLDLQEQFDFERQARIRAERHVNELSQQIECLNSQINEYNGSNSQSSEMLRRRESELSKLRKDLELANMNLENSEHHLKRKHQQLVNEFTSEVDQLHKQKSKSEKDRCHLKVELENCLSQIDSLNKSKSVAESKVESLVNQLSRTKNLNDELQNQLNKSNTQKSHLSSELFNLKNVNQDLEMQISTFAKTKSSLDHHVEELKRALDTSEKEKSLLQIQLSQAQTSNAELQAQYNDEAEEASSLRGQLMKATTELATLKSRYEKELALKTEEYDDLRRKMQLRLAELQDIADRETHRANSLEKVKSKLHIEIKELHLIIENLNGDRDELLRRAKEAEQNAVNLSRQLDDVNFELGSLKQSYDQMKADNTKLKQDADGMADKLGQLEAEKKALNDAIKEAKGELKAAKDKMGDMQAANERLKNANDSLVGELDGAKMTLQTMETNSVLMAGNSLSQQDPSKSGHGLAGQGGDKDSEIEALRKSQGKRVEELTIIIQDLELKHKSEMNRLRKKYESIIAELEAQLDALTKVNMNLTKENKSLMARVRELENLYEEERKTHACTQDSLQMCDKKRLQLQNDLDTQQTISEAAERARKNAENELADSQSRVTELTTNNLSLQNEKRRLDCSISSLQTEFDEVNNTKTSLEDRITRLQAEIGRITDELHLEQENYKSAEGLRKKLEIELREMTARLEENESSSIREARRLAQKLQARVRDLEDSLDIEQQRLKDTQNTCRKFERQARELVSQTDNDQKVILDLQDALDKACMKARHYKKQLEECEETNTINMNRMKKANLMLEEAQQRADLAERNFTIKHTKTIRRSVARAGSMTRELYLAPRTIVRSSTVANELPGVSTILNYSDEE